MKLISAHADGGRRLKGSRSGFTLVEAITAATLVALVGAALFEAQLMALRLSELVESKGGSSDAARGVLQMLPVNIRSAKSWQIGSLSGTNFVAITNGPIQGQALQLCQTTNGSQFTVYYFITNAGPSGGVLMSSPMPNWSPVVVASNLINTMQFDAELYNGTTETNDVNQTAYKNIIHTTLQFCQFQYPLTSVGSNGLYNYYRLDFRATPHLPE